MLTSKKASFPGLAALGVGLIPKLESKTFGDGEFEFLGENMRVFLPRCFPLLGNGIGVRFFISAKV